MKHSSAYYVEFKSTSQVVSEDEESAEVCLVTNRECVDDFTIDLEDKESDEFTDKAGLCSAKAIYIYIHMFEPAPVVLYIHNCKRQCFFPNIYIYII